MVFSFILNDGKVLAVLQSFGNEVQIVATYSYQGAHVLVITADKGLHCDDAGLYCDDTGFRCDDTGLQCDDTGLQCESLQPGHWSSFTLSMINCYSRRLPR